MQTYQKITEKCLYKYVQILKIPSVTKRNRWDNCYNQRISANIYRPKLLGKVFLQCKYLSNEDINYITVITVKRAIIPFILITSHRSIELTFFKFQCKEGRYKPFFSKTAKVSPMERWDVIKIKVLYLHFSNIYIEGILSPNSFVL